MQSPGDWQAALDAMAGGATLVTGNARLARRALGDDAQRRAASGESVWLCGDALSWSAWLQRLHADALAAGVIAADEAAVLLSPAQCEALWQRVVEEDRERSALLQSAVAAREAMQAEALCAAWELEHAAVAEYRHHDDVAAFLRWSTAVAARLRDNGWLAPSHLATRAIDWLTREPGLRPAALWLAGFEEFTPQQRRLLDALTALDVPVHEVAPASPADGAAVRTGCSDADAELVAAAHWARRRLQRDPAARIGVVVPDLGQRRDAVARALDAVLCPAACADPAGGARRPWNVSLGGALADEPMVHDALALLAAVDGRLEFGTASRLLRSPFIVDAGREHGARLFAEGALRERGEPTLNTAWLVQVARAADAEAFAAALERMLAVAAEAGRAPLTAWAERFTGQLQAAGWPGGRGRDSREHQCVMAWQELLSELASLGTVQGPCDRRRALAQLRRLAGARVFQPQGAPAPVQVLGPLEALGQRFDALWLVGLHDEAWPRAPRPNPFLPMRMQREHALPHATAERELAYATRLTAHLLGAAPEVVASWPMRAEDRTLRPSPLIAGLPERDAAQPAFDPPDAVVLASARFETVPAHADPAPPLRTTERVRGGSRLFQDQSQCPFRAFAVHRLHARPLETPQAGLDPLQRGSLVHEVLDRLWTQLRTRAALARLAADERAERVAAVVGEVVGEAAQRNPVVFTPRYTQVERERLAAVVQQWLELELARPEFTVVQREATLPISVGALTVHGRVDRIDELADGSRVLVDYKTGRSAKPTQWLGERPEDPQLPLYATQYGDELAGVLIGQVHAHDCAWLGVVRDEAMAPGAAVPGLSRGAFRDIDWDALRQGWREAVERLADGVAAGRAEVDPLPNACRYCHLPALCRVDELRGGFARDADAQGGGQAGGKAGEDGGGRD